MLNVYADGGTIYSNPSSVGGTYGWVQVGDSGECIAEGFGVLTPDQGMNGKVTNNVAELHALTVAVLTVAAGSDARFHSDSQCTLLRVFQNGACNGVPLWLREQLKCAKQHLRTLNHLEWVQMDGHPTKAQIAEGRGKNGNPVSRWNMVCDVICRAAGLAHVDRLYLKQGGK